MRDGHGMSARPHVATLSALQWSACLFANASGLVSSRRPSALYDVALAAIPDDAWDPDHFARLVDLRDDAEDLDEWKIGSPLASRRGERSGNVVRLMQELSDELFRAYAESSRSSGAWRPWRKKMWELRVAHVSWMRDLPDPSPNCVFFMRPNETLYESWDEGEAEDGDGDDPL